MSHILKLISCKRITISKKVTCYGFNNKLSYDLYNKDSLLTKVIRWHIVNGKNSSMPETTFMLLYRANLTFCTELYKTF